MAMQTLLSRTGALVPHDSKTVRSFRFEVPEGTAAMALVVEWTPGSSTDAERNRAVLEEAMASWGGPSVASGEDVFDNHDVRRCVKQLPNLLNTVLVEPSGRWRGRSDRGKGTRDKPLLIDPSQPGPGFLAGAIEPGTWSLDLEVHSVVTDSCEFFLEVRQIEAAGAPVDVPLVKDAPVPPAGEGYYRGELHTHTRHSDGSHTVAELTRRAKALGLDFIALTDHNTTSGGRDLDDAALPVVLGAELTTFRGHHVVLGLDEMMPWHEDGVVLDVNEVVRRVKEKGALFTLTHPFNLGDPICTGCRWMTPELERSQVDLVEIWHRRWTGDSADNPAARGLWDELWRDGHRPVAICARDWHSGQHEAELPGPLPTTVVRSRSLAPADLLAGIRQGAVYITRGPKLDFSLVTPSERSLTLGERAPFEPGELRALVQLEELEELEEPARLELYRRGEKVAEQRVDGCRTVELTLPAAPGWYRVELWGDDAPFVITNHVELVG